jgi:uncharacterized protein
MKQTPRRVLIIGASGFIGRNLCRRLLADGVEVLAWQHRSALPPGLSAVTTVASLAQIPDDSRIDAVVNLAGARILGPPWTAARRQLLLASRLDPTTGLCRWIERRAQRPRVLVNASAIGYYGLSGDSPVDESGPSQPIFQSALCRQWEEAAHGVTPLGVRLAVLRFGVVLGIDGGALPALLLPARFGLGAVLGDGRQGAPWIHIDDAVGLVLCAMVSDSLQGPVNAVAPGHVSQREFQQALTRALSRPLWLRVPAWPLRVALGEMAQLLVDGQHVVPRRALESGYRFAFPDLPAAMADLLVSSRQS